MWVAASGGGPHKNTWGEGAGKVYFFACFSSLLPAGSSPLLLQLFFPNTRVNLWIPTQTEEAVALQEASRPLVADWVGLVTHAVSGTEQPQ